MLLLENEAQVNKNNYWYGKMFFMSKQVRLPKIGLILRGMKISPKSDICFFLPAELAKEAGTKFSHTEWGTWVQARISVSRSVT